MTPGRAECASGTMPASFTLAFRLLISLQCGSKHSWLPKPSQHRQAHNQPISQPSERSRLGSGYTCHTGTTKSEIELRSCFEPSEDAIRYGNAWISQVASPGSTFVTLSIQGAHKRPMLD